MDGSSAFRGVTCAECGATPTEPALVTACAECGGRLETHYEFDGTIDPSDLPRSLDQYRFSPLLPFDRERAVTFGEGATPLVDCPTLADEAGVDRLLVKDEGTNPTGAFTDRGVSLAVTAAAEARAETVALPSTGHGGRSVAAYAGRAELDTEVFVPARAPFDCKAMVNVHGGEMAVVGGRYPDAVAAFESEYGRERERSWADLGPGSVYRREGATSLYGELLAGVGWTVPDAIVVPEGNGAIVTGLAQAIWRFEAAGVVSDAPALVVAQPEGCAPIVGASSTDVPSPDRSIESVEHPDTIAGALEIPAPTLGGPAVHALDQLDGRAVAVPDDDALAAAVEATAVAGVEVGVAGGVALAAAANVAANLGSGETVVVLNPTAGGTESDVLRSHLMGQGV